MAKLLALVLAILVLAILGVMTMQPQPIVCAYPPGRLGATQAAYYTLDDGRDADAVCTEAGWLVQQ